MSARVESAPVGGSFPASIVIAIIAALGIGVAAGTLITKAVDDRPTAVATSVGSPLWDAQKLEAMQGRALAEQYRVGQPLAWDAQKLEAMAGRVLYQPVAVEPESVTTAKPSITRPDRAFVGWDAYKLQAMKGRVLAEQARAEDPPVKPHLPKRPPGS
jgi:hypothetical protein